jgi:hypothetical protein
MRIEYISWTQSPVSCRLKNVRVHQTLVWLNLLSFGTKGSIAPTIGIQSDAVGEAKATAGLGWAGVMYLCIDLNYVSFLAM